ncbi:MAG: hypothetical protein ACP5PX_04235 [Candidatus Hadarchaeum sp.]|uniref:hypothetical protein n=1 Tax=Candidatus Hadarchaeum sp. TaxID=2883567 RepID=UPI003D09CAB6
MVCLTKTGKSVKAFSGSRHLLPIIAIAENERVAKSMIPFWCVVVEIVEGMKDFASVLERLVEKNF